MNQTLSFGIDPLRLSGHVQKRLTSLVVALIASANIVLLGIYAWEVVGSANAVWLFLYEWPTFWRGIAAIGGGLIFGSILLPIHRMVFIGLRMASQPQYLIVYAVVVIGIQWALSKPVEMMFSTNAIDRWFDGEQKKIKKEVHERETAKLTAERDVKAKEATDKVADAKTAFEAKRATQRAELQQRRTQGAQERAERSKASVSAMRAAAASGAVKSKTAKKAPSAPKPRRPAIRAPRTVPKKTPAPTADTAALAQASAAKTAAVAGVTTTAFSSEDTWQGETESLFAKFDEETPKLLLADPDYTKLVKERDDLEAKYKADQTLLDGMDVFALVAKYEPGRWVPVGGWYDSAKALDAIRSENADIQNIVLAVALGVILAMLLFSTMTKPFLFWSDAELSVFDRQKAVVDGLIAFEDEKRAIIGNRKGHGLFSPLREIRKEIAAKYQETVGTKINALDVAEKKVRGMLRGSVPEWDERNAKPDPRAEGMYDRLVAITPELITECGWENPEPMIREAEQARMFLVRRVYPGLRQSYDLILVPALRALIEADRQIPLQALRDVATQWFVKSRPHLVAMMNLEEVVKAAGLELPKFPLEPMFKRDGIMEIWQLSEQLLRSLGWQGQWQGRLPQGEGVNDDFVRGEQSRFAAGNAFAMDMEPDWYRQGRAAALPQPEPDDTGSGPSTPAVPLPRSATPPPPPVDSVADEAGKPLIRRKVGSILRRAASRFDGESDARATAARTEAGLASNRDSALPGDLGDPRERS